MKKNKEIRELLTKAFHAASTTFELQEVRYHILQALNKVQKIEHKDDKKKTEQQPTNHQNWQQLVQDGLKNINSPSQTLDTINQMIAMEENKLKEIIANKHRKPSSDDTEVQTFFE